MAKILLALLGVLVLLNAMTFLVVVNQGNFTAEESVSVDAVSKKDADVQTRRIEKIETTVQGLKTSLGDLSRKLDDLPRRIAVQSPRSSSPSATSRPLSSPPVSTPRTARTPPARTGPSDYSRVTPPAGPSPETESGLEEVEENASQAPATDVTVQPGKPAGAGQSQHDTGQGEGVEQGEENQQNAGAAEAGGGTEPAGGTGAPEGDGQAPAVKREPEANSAPPGEGASGTEVPPGDEG